MLLTSTYYSHMPNQQYATHAPIRSSPLREPSANAGASLFDFSMASQHSEKETTQSQRVYKANPVMQTRDAATKRRRDMFFKRVQNNREEKKWESRGEQLQQLDFVSERKRWEMRKAREAPAVVEEIEDDLLSDATLPDSSNNAPQLEPGMTEAEYLLAQEEYELQQLIASMDTEECHTTMPQQHYGSDDEEYDQIFMDCATNIDTEYQHQSQGQHEGYKDVDDMDMTDD
ncbi:hypothetical protein C7974DRAFT_136937 [Boeremia exigua]|uniref:uncharacterized protein n=1 Tax=Boeremia exigua TaxID=749465 RepID=UPI001E8DA421|nr:uncharacterized protein C7974DRAFT_136937 [Boeremia exigua]KAH6639688.1 hypothetical protein C7974DRAFT_136937 [Boeremia exigua]